MSEKKLVAYAMLTIEDVGHFVMDISPLEVVKHCEINIIYDFDGDPGKTCRVLISADKSYEGLIRESFKTGQLNFSGWSDRFVLEKQESDEISN